MKYKMRVFSSDYAMPEIYTAYCLKHRQSFVGACMSFEDDGNGYTLFFDSKKAPLRVNYSEMGDLFELLLWQQRMTHKRGHVGLIDRKAHRSYTKVVSKKRKKHGAR